MSANRNLYTRGLLMGASALMVVFGVGASRGQEKIGIEDKSVPFHLILPLIQELDRLPPVEMEFDFGMEQSEGTFRVWRHRFLQFDRMWRQERRENSELDLVAAYDGQRYYRFGPTDGNLHVTTDADKPAPMRRVVFSALNNPIYSWMFPFFLHDQSDFTSEGMVDPGVWSEVLAEFSTSKIDAKGRGERFLLDAHHLQFEIEFGEVGTLNRVTEIILRHRNIATGKFRDSQSRIEYKGWRVEKVGEKSIVLPNEIITHSRYHDGRKVPGGDQWFRMVPGSVKALPEDTQAAVFRVPLSSVSDPVIFE